MTGLTVITPPDGEALSLDAAKDYLRIGTDGEDALVTALVQARWASLEGEVAGAEDAEHVVADAGVRAGHQVGVGLDGLWGGDADLLLKAGGVAGPGLVAVACHCGPVARGELAFGGAQVGIEIGDESRIPVRGGALRPDRPMGGAGDHLGCGLRYGAGFHAVLVVAVHIVRSLRGGGQGDKGQGGGEEKTARQQRLREQGRGLAFILTHKC